MDSLYKKWRPLQFSDMIGQDNVIRTLSRATETGRFNHAYLLGGQHGSGKTTAARILAATLVCPSKETGTGRPCGACKVCKSIHNGYCVDVYEMDGADKRKVEDARKIIETSQYPPNELSHKIYIIDECHKLTGEASSALLKTIEEPPQNVVFILCTTEVRTLMPTIKSRCQRLMFTKISTDLIAQRLSIVAEREGITMDPMAAFAIARNARGSMRDAYGDLEQIATAESNNITVEAVSRNLGVPDQMITYRLVGMMASDDIPGVYRAIDQLCQAGMDARVVLAEVSEVLRNVQMISGCGRDFELLNVMEDEKVILQDLAKKIKMKTAIKIGMSVSAIEKDLSVNVNERYALEAALIQSLLLIHNDATNSPPITTMS